MDEAPHAVRHDRPVRSAVLCPDHRDDGHRRAEVLRNGDLILHCEGITGDDKLVLFDRYREEVKSLAETLDAAAPEKLRELVACSRSASRPTTGRLPA